MSKLFYTKFKYVDADLTKYPKLLKRYFYGILDVGTNTGKYYKYDRTEAERDADYEPPREILEDWNVAIVKNVSEKMIDRYNLI